mmetsp:Transcript_5073/g.5782  ORF Transcript_5073/g.5782 Transcript_5073/m.5782 type:complete len:102 (-) Transcript_5073:43-348(-)
MVFVALTIIGIYSANEMFKPSDNRTAQKIIRLILEDMKEKGLYRNGLNVSNIYNWYSSETTLKRDEFVVRIQPWIELYLNESDELRNTLNRNGVQVWKLNE